MTITKNFCFFELGFYLASAVSMGGKTATHTTTVHKQKTKRERRERKERRGRTERRTINNKTRERERRERKARMGPGLRMQ